MRPVQNRMDHSRPKYLRSQQTLTSTRLLKAHQLRMYRYSSRLTANHAFYQCFLLGLLLRSLEIFTQVQTFNCTGRLRTTCTKRFLGPQHLDICESNLGRIKSFKFIPTKVDFHGNPTSILYFLHEKFIWNLVLSRKPMFWFSI